MGHNNNPTGKNKISEEEVRQTVAVWDACFPNIRRTADKLGIHRATLQRRLTALGLRTVDANGQSVLHRSSRSEVKEDYLLPRFPDKELPAEQILDQLQEQFVQQDRHFHSMKWFEIKLRKKDPFGLCFVGDPHLGPNSNIPLLRRDAKIMAEVPGVYAINLGDVADNWGQRYLRLWAETTMTRETERRLAKWFLVESGIPWWVWLEGNHEGFDEALTVFLKATNANHVPMIDWRAQFKVTFPASANISEVKIDCAHDYKGHSMWNDLHALERASKMAGTDVADIYAAGHRHLWESKKLEVEDGRVITLLRARGYKWIDDYAHRHQFYHRRVGATVMAVINPMAESADAIVTPFSDLGEGAKYLRYLRERHS